MTMRAGDVKDEKVASGSGVNSSGALSSFSTADASVIREKLKQLYGAVQEVNEERSASEHTLSNISKAHDKLQNEPSKSQLKSNLKKLYKTAITDCEQEAESLQKCLDIIADIRTTVRNRPRKLGMFNLPETGLRRGHLMKILKSSAQTMPLFISRARDEKPPPLCGSIPADSSYIAKPGDLVAALIKPTAAAEMNATGDESNWILGEVLHFNHSNGKYEVDDVDEEEKKRHTLSRRRVVPLPLMRANPETDPDALFEKGDLVLALYPQTTCFYRGVIGKTPETSQEDYQVLFEDSSYPEGYSPPLSVPQKYIITPKKV